MATAPAVRAATHQSSFAVTTSNVTKPTGTTTNDVVYLFSTAFGSAQNVTVSGFTQVYHDVSGTGSSTTIKSCYRKIAGGSEPANYTVTGDASGNLFSVCVAISGADTTTPEDSTVGKTDVPTSTSTWTTPSINLLTPTGLQLGVVHVATNQATNVTGTGWTLADEVAYCHVLARSSATAAGPTGTFGLSGTAAVSVSFVRTLMIRPTGGATFVTRPTSAAPPTGYRGGAHQLTTGAWTPLQVSHVRVRQGLMPAPCPIANTHHIGLGASDAQGSLTGVTDITSRTWQKALVACYAPRFAFGNYTSSEQFGSTDDITIRVALEIPSDNLGAASQGLSTYYPLYFSGQRDVTIKPGGVVLCDPVGLEIAAGQVFFLRSRLTATGRWPLWGQPIAAAKGFYAAHNEGTMYAAGSDLTTSGTITVADTGTPTPYVYGPVAAAAGIQNDVMVPCVALIGDSIMWGVTNTWDHFSGYEAALVTANIPYVKLALIGEQGVNFTTGSSSNRKRLLSGCNYFLDNYGINDLRAGSSGGSVTMGTAQARALLRWKQLAARGMLGYATTITPNTDATNTVIMPNGSGVATPAQETARTGYNDWLRDGAPVNNATSLTAVATGTVGALRAGSVGHPLTGYFDVADQMETARNSGLWKAAAYATVAGGGFDGLHPDASGHSMIQNAIDTTKFVARA